MSQYSNDKYIPSKKLDENRSFWRHLVLTLVTCGIYDVVFFMSFSHDFDKIASRHDGKKSINYALVYVLALITCSIAKMFWFHDITDRVLDELERRGIDHDLSMSDFWLWNVLGSLILVGHFVFLYKLIKAMNLICKSYNEEQEELDKQARRSY